MDNFSNVDMSRESIMFTLFRYASDPKFCSGSQACGPKEERKVRVRVEQAGRPLPPKTRIVFVFKNIYPRCRLRKHLISRGAVF